MMRRFVPLAVLARLASLAAFAWLTPTAAGAQVMQVRPVTPEAAAPRIGELREQQRLFESYRRGHLPRMDFNRRAAELSGGRRVWRRDGRLRQELP